MMLGNGWATAKKTLRICPPAQRSAAKENV